MNVFVDYEPDRPRSGAVSTDSHVGIRSVCLSDVGALAEAMAVRHSAGGRSRLGACQAEGQREAAMGITDPHRNIPERLNTPEFALRPIVADDAASDHAAVMESRGYLRL